jgi:hypothetical protein
MPSRAGRVNETEVALATMQYLNTLPSKEATIDEIVNALPDFLTLGENDREQSETRPHEEIWEQQVRNIVSHKATSSNAVNLGYLEGAGGRLTLTEAGAAHLKANGL